MKHYGLDIPEGEDITNLTAPTGTSFPSGSPNPANAGELFFRSDLNTLYVYDGSSWKSTTAASGSGSGVFETALLHVQDQKPTGTNGGASTAGFNTRVLNTVLVNEIGATLSSNQITLQSGIYYLEASAPAYYIALHQLWVYNVTGATYVVGGAANRVLPSGSYIATTAQCAGRFTLSTTSVIELRHYIQNAYAYGLGPGITSTVSYNIFADVRIWKVA